MLASLLVLTGVVAGSYALLVKPPEKSTTLTTTAAVEVVDPVTGEVSTVVKETVPVIDEETGEEIHVEFEVPGSLKEGYYNILVVGTDDDGTRTDTIMIARLDTVEDTVALLSVPRDTLINTSASVPKINSVYGNNGGGEKGMAALISQLKSILGFEVDGYIMVDLDAFVAVIDLVGGVPFDVPVNMYYNDPTQDLYINIAAGYQVLDGENAMKVVRYRDTYAEGDIKRTEVQQDFIQALANQCLKIGNLSKIGDFIDVFATYVDTDLSVGNMVYFAKELLECNFDEMYTETLPGDGTAYINGYSVYALYANQTLAIINEYFNPYDTDISISSLNIRSGYSGSSSSSSSASSSASSYSASDEDDDEEDVDDEDTPLLDVGVDEDDVTLELDDETEDDSDDATDSDSSTDSDDSTDSDTDSDDGTDSDTSADTDSGTDSATDTTTPDTTLDVTTDDIVLDV